MVFVTDAVLLDANTSLIHSNKVAHIAMRYIYTVFASISGKGKRRQLKSFNKKRFEFFRIASLVVKGDYFFIGKILVVGEDAIVVVRGAGFEIKLPVLFQGSRDDYPILLAAAQRRIKNGGNLFFFSACPNRFPTLCSPALGAKPLKVFLANIKIADVFCDGVNHLLLIRGRIPSKRFNADARGF